MTILFVFSIVTIMFSVTSLPVCNTLTGVITMPLPWTTIVWWWWGIGVVVVWWSVSVVVISRVGGVISWQFKDTDKDCLILEWRTSQFLLEPYLFVWAGWIIWADTLGISSRRRIIYSLPVTNMSDLVQIILQLLKKNIVVFYVLNSKQKVPKWRYHIDPYNILTMTIIFVFSIVTVTVTVTSLPIWNTLTVVITQPLPWTTTVWWWWGIGIVVVWWSIGVVVCRVDGVISWETNQKRHVFWHVTKMT